MASTRPGHIARKPLGEHADEEEGCAKVYAEGVWPGRSALASWQTPWLLNKRWDLTYVSLSAILVPTPFILFSLFNRFGVPGNLVGPSAAVDILVALVVGGPHMWSTY